MENITNLDKMSEEDIASVFELYFGEQVAKENNIDEFEASCERDNIGDDITIKVMVVGLAGTPTPDDFKTGNVESADIVSVPTEDNENIKFELDAAATTALNTNDYWLYYKITE